MSDHPFVLPSAQKAQLSVSSREGKRESKTVAKKILPMLISAFFVGSLTSSLVISSAQAIDLEMAFALAKKNDPKYQAAKSEKTATTADSVRSWLAYAPTYTYSQQQLPTLNTTSTTQTVTQPLFNAAKGAEVMQANSRGNLADFTFIVSTQELATRTFNAVSQIVLATEAIKANDGRINALESQYQGAKRKFELGQGTVTDLLDVQVKFEQAKADALTLRANLKGAKDQFNAIVGQYPDNTDFALPNKHEIFKVALLDEILAQVEKANPNILAAKANESIAKYDIAKASAAILPSIGYTYQKTQYTNVNQENNGITMSIPLDIGSYVGTYAAYAKAKQSSSMRLDTETKAKVEAQRLYELIDAGQQSLKIKAQAMDTARQSVTANQKSYEAGVKSTTDVLIAIQTLFQARNDYAQAAVQQANQLLNLLLVGAEDPDQAVQRTQAFLFRK